jgi:hypothetical protein
MGWFSVKSAYYHPLRDAIVLTGHVVEGPVEPGLWLDFPKGDGGPTRVPIAEVTTVQYQGGKPPEDAVVIDYRHIQKYWDWDAATWEGKLLEVKG